jgi:hypothetical protein
MAQVVEHLPHKCKALSSNPSTGKRKKWKKKKKEGKWEGGRKEGKPSIYILIFRSS